MKKDNPSILLSISKNILFAWRKILDFENPSGARGKECAQLYLSLDKSLEIIAHSSKDASYDSFDEVHKIIIKMKEDSMRAVRGAFNSSFLHEEALELTGKFEIELMKVKKKVVNETLKNKDNEIKQLKESREQERTAFNEKLTKMEVESAQAKAESAQAKIESAQAKVESAQAKVESAQAITENVEMKKRQTQMEKQLNALMRQVGASTFNSDTSSNLSGSENQARGQTHRFYRP